MKTILKIAFTVMVGFVLLMTAGCTKKAVRTTGFLTDYTRLEPANGSLRYINMKRLGEYSSFIVEPVVVHLYGIPQGARPDPAARQALANYLHNVIISAISDRYMIVSQPGSGIGRIRIALTDLEKSTPALNVLPQTKLTGIGLGSASMEGEVLDSQTGEQIGALIESKKGSRVSLSGMKEWGDAQSVMDEWAKRFRKRLDEAHGY
jgi:hypothetical protein